MNYTRSKTPEEHTFSAENIRNCERYVFSMQKRLDKAVANNDKKRIRHILDILTKKSKAVKTLAVYRITIQNSGKYTAGVDGKAIPKSNKAGQMKMRVDLLNNIDIKSKPDKIRRTFIPKPNGKKRPLGIPTLKDRIVQDILRTALEPIVEYHSHNSSYGFRPKRSCHDAIGRIFGMLAIRNRRRYIIEGDIKGCFDNISHKHILNTLKEWNTTSQLTNIIERILKAKIFHNGKVYDSETGTPQGGVISPMLANVALTAFDNFCEKNYGTSAPNKGKRYIATPLVRYADDFIIACKSKTEATHIKSEISTFLSENIGLTLSKEKTAITHIKKGFNFLGFTIKKHPKRKGEKLIDMKDYVLWIEPQREKVIAFLRDYKEVLSTNKTAKQSSLIRMLNPKVRGFGYYYRYVGYKRRLGLIDHITWHSLLRWCKRMHPNKSTKWIMRKYFKRINPRKFSTHFHNREENLTLFSMGELPRNRYAIVPYNRRVYNPDDAEYWIEREGKQAYLQLTSSRMRTLFGKQKGKCASCEHPITQSQISNSETHIHHMNPRSLGGNVSYSNLRLLHSECHRELHSKISRKEMNELSNKNVDYLSDNVIDYLESRVR